MHQPTPPQPGFFTQFTPKLVTVFREGYGWRDLRADAVAGLTVAVVALPLSMGIAIASGVSPERGIYTAIAGGFIVSFLGGSRFQIGGPAGAFIGIVAAVVARHGYDGLALATAMSGVILIAAALLRVGTYVRYIPHPVIVGFTAGIAVIIAASQVSELMGLTVTHEPPDLIPKLMALRDALPTLKWQTVMLAVFSIATILAVRKAKPEWPAFLIGIAAATALSVVLHLDVSTVASRFGEVPRSLPAPSFPAVSIERLVTLLPDAIAMAVLGAIESLLSAMVADKMGDAHHRSNGELGAQGLANIVSTVFGGFCVTGTIARTATNVRAGSRGPMSGILHCVYLLTFLFAAAPLVGFIPLAALAAMLIVVSWNMVERAEFAALLRGEGDYMGGGTAILLATFLLTIFINLLAGIAVGAAMGVVFYYLRQQRDAV
jgi:SulP family sulfate permease